MDADIVFADVQVADQIFQDLAESQSHDCQIVTPQAHNRQTDDKTGHTGQNAAAQHRQSQTDKIAVHNILQQRSNHNTGKGADAHKTSMAKAQFTGNTNHQVQRNSQNDVGADGHQETLDGAAHVSGQGQQLQYHKANNDNAIGQQIGLLLLEIILQFHGTHLTLSPECSCPEVRRASQAGSRSGPGIRLHQRTGWTDRPWRRSR